MGTQREIVIALFLFRRNPRPMNLRFYYTVIIILLLPQKPQCHNQSTKLGLFHVFLFIWPTGPIVLNHLLRPRKRIHPEFYSRYSASIQYYYYMHGSVRTGVACITGHANERCMSALK